MSKIDYNTIDIAYAFQWAKSQIYKYLKILHSIKYND